MLDAAADDRTGLRRGDSAAGDRAQGRPIGCCYLRNGSLNLPIMLVAPTTSGAMAAMSFG
jgi:hypothetical protein